MPEMIRFYLGEEPLLANVTTYLLDDPEQLEAALARIDQLVFKPTGESGGSGVVIGPAADERRLIELAAAVRRDPSRWIARGVRHSTVPTVAPTARWRRGTSICARSRSSARRSASCPAA